MITQLYITLNIKLQSIVFVIVKINVLIVRRACTSLFMIALCRFFLLNLHSLTEVCVGDQC